MTHTFTKHLYHWVWSTKDRKPYITPVIEKQLYPYLASVVAKHGGICIVVGGTFDHLHLLVKLKPSASVSNLISALKVGSSGWIHQHFQEPGFRWQAGYGSFTVCTSQEERVKRYIINQRQHHQTESFYDEFSGLLDAHGVDYDPEYLFT